MPTAARSIVTTSRRGETRPGISNINAGPSEEGPAPGSAPGAGGGGVGGRGGERGGRGGQLRIIQCIQAASERPFCWGENDCCLFVADVCLAACDRDPAAA
ncbi:DUF6950 family protein, partial [Aeromonas caviae]|uniref:DUF6950 family protein n=1 Tax=Aeromonas caviae TaxID=648 RepID=UPI003F49335C